MKTERIAFEDQVVTTTHSLAKIMDEMVRTSFFLPPDVMQVVGLEWDLQPITLCSHSEWLKSQQFMLDYGAVLKYENGSKLLVATAKTVAVSIRRHRQLNEWLVLVRPWVAAGEEAMEFNLVKKFPRSAMPERGTYKKKGVAK